MTRICAKLRGLITLQIEIGLCVALFFIIFTGFTSASEELMLAQPSTNTNGSSDLAQSFIATGTNISSFSFYIYRVEEPVCSLTARLCLGSYDAATTSTANIRCLGSGQTELRNIYYPNYANATSTYSNFNFSDIIISSGTSYIVSLEDVGDTCGDLSISTDNTDPYPDGRTSSANVDVRFHIYTENTYYDPSVEIIELEDWRGSVSVESEYHLSYNDYNYCTIDFTCRVWANYNREVIGDDFYLTPLTSEGCLTPNNAIDEFQAIDGLLLQDYFNIPATSTIGTQSYCIYHERQGEDDVLYYPVYVVWSYENTILDDLFDDYNCETICNDISTSSDSFWDGARYGIECGFRKIICWALRPTDESIKDFAVSVYSIKHSFPFSIFYQVEKEIKSIDFSQASTTITFNPATFGLPRDEEWNFLSTSTLSKFFGTVIWDDGIYRGLEIFIYLLGLGYIVFRIFKIAKAHNTEEKL